MVEWHFYDQIAKAWNFYLTSGLCYAGFDEESYHAGEAHTLRNWEQPSLNSQWGTEALSPPTLKELKPVNSS